MYYKIENKACEVYQKLHELRTKELQMDKENLQLIKERVGIAFLEYKGTGNQRGCNRVNTYSGFKFMNQKQLSPNIWKKDENDEEYFLPNKRTKAGRAMLLFLENGLQSSRFQDVFKILGLDQMPHGWFSMPYVEIKGDVILVYVDGKTPLTDDNIIEITSKEFNQISNQDQQ